MRPLNEALILDGEYEVRTAIRALHTTQGANSGYEDLIAQLGVSFLNKSTEAELVIELHEPEKTIALRSLSQYAVLNSGCHAQQMLNEYARRSPAS